MNTRFVLLLLVGTMGCSKSSEHNRARSEPSFVVSPEDGAELFGSASLEIREPNSATNQAPTLTLSGSADGEYLTMDLAVASDTVPGEYVLSGGARSASTSALMRGMDGREYAARAGRVVIRPTTKGRIEGRFEALLAPVDATDGSTREVHGTFAGRMAVSCYALANGIRDDSSSGPGATEEGDAPQWQADPKFESAFCRTQRKWEQVSN